MCVFGGQRAPTPLPTPAPYQPRVQQQKQEAVRPEKKELLDPDETAEVAYGSGAKKGAPSAGKKTGTDALTRSGCLGCIGAGVGIGVGADLNRHIVLV